MARFQWNEIPTKLDIGNLIRILNNRMTQLRSFFTGIVRLESGYQISRYLELPRIDAEPDAPTQGVRLFVVQNGGKDELRARFPTGATQTISTEP